MPTETVARAVRDGIARTLAVIGLAGVALDLPGKFAETPYLAWLYIGLIAGCLVVAASLFGRSDPRAWTAAALLPLGALVGYTLTPTSRLRHRASDVDPARGAAAARARCCAEQLRRAGFDAEGLVGDSDPVQALADALVFFEADLTVVDESFAERARSVSGLPIVSGMSEGRPLDAAA